MVNDWEGLKGRKTYARIGGCYYAARNMCSEYLNNQRLQCKMIIFRESYPEFLMPLGVWLTREAVRQALSKPFLKFDTLEEAKTLLKERLRIPLGHWKEISGILSHDKSTRQKSLYAY